MSYPEEEATVIEILTKLFTFPDGGPDENITAGWAKSYHELVTNLGQLNRHVEPPYIWQAARVQLVAGLIQRYYIVARQAHENGDIEMNLGGESGELFDGDHH